MLPSKRTRPIVSELLHRVLIVFRFVLQSLYFLFRILHRNMMQSVTSRHSSIHTVTFAAKKKPRRGITMRKMARQSIVIMNQLADARNEGYLQRLQEYYEQLEVIMRTHSHRRIKSDTLQFSVFVINQLLLTFLKYSILRGSPNMELLIRVFSVMSLFSGIYFISLHMLNFGIETFLKVYFCLDKLLLILVGICMTNGVAIGVLGLSSGQTLSLQVFFPFWLLYSAATVRIQVINYKWAKLQIIISKIVHLISFSLVLAFLWQFIYYQRAEKLPTKNSATIAMIYGLAVSVYFVQFYRLISKFDGTNDLRHQYQFENHGEKVIRKKKKELQEKLKQWNLIK